MNNANVKALTLAVAEITKALQAKAENGKAGSSEGQKVITHLRAYAVASEEAGMDKDNGAAYLTRTLEAAGIKAGTIRPYRAAYTGYRQALSEGDSITDTGDGKAMTAPQAQAYNVPKSQRDDAKLRKDVMAEINKRLKAIAKTADLIEFRDTLPEVEGEATTIVAPDLADFLPGLDDEDVADVQAAVG